MAAPSPRTCRLSPSARSRRARRTDDGWVLPAPRPWSAPGRRADLLLVTASTPDGVGVFLVEAGTDGVTT